MRFIGLRNRDIHVLNIDYCRGDCSASNGRKIDVDWFRIEFLGGMRQNLKEFEIFSKLSWTCFLIENLMLIPNM